jgi:glucokinase
MTYLLAGDIGGTKTILRLVRAVVGAPPASVLKPPMQAKPTPIWYRW